MDKADFERQLHSGGYVEMHSKSLDARPANDLHAHDFDVRGLVLKGAFTVVLSNGSTTYLPGEVFSVAAGIEHSEMIGADGAEIFVGRKYQR